jgi:hypothetical protein
MMRDMRPHQGWQKKLSNVLALSAVAGHGDLQMLKRCYHPRAEDLAEKLD